MWVDGFRGKRTEEEVENGDMRSVHVFCPHIDYCPLGDYGGEDVCNCENFAMCHGYNIMQSMTEANELRYGSLRL